MDLRDLIGRIGREYDRGQDFASPAQQLLKMAGAEIERWAPAGYVGFGSGGVGNTATIPWIAVFDPDETNTAQHGMYVVYLFAADGSRVFLTLAQGVTELVNRWGRREGRVRLRAQAVAIRDAIPIGLRAGLIEGIELGSTMPLAVQYTAGVIVGREYSITDLPSEDVMVADLRRMIHLYQVAIDVREQLRATTTDIIVTTSTPAETSKPQPEFKPKNDADYLQQVAARMIKKSRKHETLVKEYGEFLINRGFAPATNVHPRDLVAERGQDHWLIEAKTVPLGNGVTATRDALSQLLFYRHFHYREPNTVRMLALFNESVGAACVAFLEEMGVASVWQADGKWIGSPSAIVGGLCSETEEPRRE